MRLRRLVSPAHPAYAQLRAAVHWGGHYGPIHPDNDAQGADHAPGDAADDRDPDIRPVGYPARRQAREQQADASARSKAETKNRPKPGGFSRISKASVGASRPGAWRCGRSCGSAAGPRRSSPPASAAPAKSRHCRSGSPSTASSLAVSTISERLPGSAKAFSISTEMRPLAIELSSGAPSRGRDATTLSCTGLPASEISTSLRDRRRASGLVAAALLDIGDDVVAPRLAAGEVQFERADLVAFDGQRMAAAERRPAVDGQHRPALPVDRSARAIGQRRRIRRRSGIRPQARRRAVITFMVRNSSRDSMRIGSHGGIFSAISSRSTPPPISTVYRASRPMSRWTTTRSSAE